MCIKWPVIIVLVLILLLSVILLYPKIENFFIFFPQSTFNNTPDKMGLNFKDIYFHTKDGIKNHGWFFPLNQEAPVILFCHGNAGNISHRLENVKLLLESGIQVFIFDYRGYGKSKGSPTERGIYEDGLAAYDYLVQQKNIQPSDIVLFGRSLGAAVAIHVSLNRKAKALIIESGFLSTKEMAKTMPLFNLFHSILPEHYDNLRKITHIKVPKLVIHGDRDEIVPFYMGKRLYNTSKDPKFFYQIERAGHNDTYIMGGKKYFRIIASFSRDLKI